MKDFSFYMNQAYYSPDKVLLVHNQTATLEVMQRYLEAHSYEVDCVLEAEHAKLLMELLGYSTVIIDRSLLCNCNFTETDIIGYLAQSHPEARIIVLDMAESVEIANRFLPTTPVTAH